jgi:hypothetical protein
MFSLHLERLTFGTRSTHASGLGNPSAAVALFEQEGVTLQR